MTTLLYQVIVAGLFAFFTVTTVVAVAGEVVRRRRWIRHVDDAVTVVMGP